MAAGSLQLPNAKLMERKYDRSMNGNRWLTGKKGAFYAVLLFIMLSLPSCGLIEGLQPVDPQSATLTALVTPTSVQPTPDLKGNVVLEGDACNVFSGPIISTFQNAEDGGIFSWADNVNKLAYVVPQNRYWAWFSGDAEVLDFEENLYIPRSVSTTGLNVFGDFAFNPSATKLAFVVLRPSEKVYSVMVASLMSDMKMTVDLFPDTGAVTDGYSSAKSVIDWHDDDSVRVATSCGADCERIYLINTVTGSTQLLEETRKRGHDGRVFPMKEVTYDVRHYPAMINPVWSWDNRYVLYSDELQKTWILDDQTKEQFEIPIVGPDIWQVSWSYDARFVAIRLRESLAVYKIDCNE